jgi:tetratricopeptide (TPR) repeat protein
VSLSSQRRGSTVAQVGLVALGICLILGLVLLRRSAIPLSEWQLIASGVFLVLAGVALALTLLGLHMLDPWLDTPAYREAVRQGQRALDSGFPSKAIVHFSQALAYDETHGANLGLAVAFEQLGQLETAADHYHSARLKAARHNSRAAARVDILLAHVYLRLGDLERSIEISSRALSALPDSNDPAVPDAYMVRGMARFRRGDDRGALADLEWVSVNAKDTEQQRLARTFAAAVGFVDAVGDGVAWEQYADALSGNRPVVGLPSKALEYLRKSWFHR